jgi:hypothetical protein
MEEANRKLCEMAQEETTKVLNRVLQTATEKMKTDITWRTTDNPGGERDTT